MITASVTKELIDSEMLTVAKVTELSRSCSKRMRFLLLLGNSVYKERCVLKVKWNLIFEHLLRLFELATLLNMENAIFLLIRPKYNSMQIQ